MNKFLVYDEDEKEDGYNVDKEIDIYTNLKYRINNLLSNKA